MGFPVLGEIAGNFSPQEGKAILRSSYRQHRSSMLKTFCYLGIMPLFCREGLSKYSLISVKDIDPVLLTIKNVAVLTLSKWTFKLALICPSLSPLHVDFQLCNLKDMWWIDDSDERFDIHTLVSLEQLFITINYIGTDLPESTAIYSIQVGRTAEFRHLKLIKLEGFNAIKQI
ncbi:hypothetical protein K2173_014520 [Erythroxylum novogranatense]|uniref:Uncharacterized protein n=1 Tax=Erythroxylum novogranatense TaxID=1862640 RepID=A0AAV8S561_9ROSI|nr:hypothetical protein K2173_014520 [Erythroxylum novogranatense]